MEKSYGGVMGMGIFSSWRFIGIVVLVFNISLAYADYRKITWNGCDFYKDNATHVYYYDQSKQCVGQDISEFTINPSTLWVNMYSGLTYVGGGSANIVTNSYIIDVSGFIVGQDPNGFNPSPLPGNEENYTDSQCQEFAGQVEGVPKSTTTLSTQMSCYKGCTVSSRGADGDNWSFGMWYFEEYDFTGGTCESIEPESQTGCFEVQDEGNNWKQICNTPPDAEPADIPPTIPSEEDPQNCLTAYDINGVAVESMCGDFDGQACWYENSQFYCAGDEYAEGFGCTKIDEYLACSALDPVTNTMSVIDPDSVDHPANGGNANGDINDDIFEPDVGGNVSGGGFGYGSTGSYTQTNPSTSDQLLAADIGRSVAIELSSELVDMNDSLNAIEDELTDTNSLNNSYEGGADNVEEVSSMGSGWKSAIEGSTTVQGYMGLKEAMAGKTDKACPVWEFDFSDVGWGKISSNIHCEIYSNFKVTLRAIFMLVYLFYGFRIFMSA